MKNRKAPMIVKTGKKEFTVVGTSHLFWSGVTAKFDRQSLVELAGGISLTYEQLGQLAVILGAPDPIAKAAELGWETRDDTIAPKALLSKAQAH